MPYEGILDTSLFIRFLHDGSSEEREKFKKLIRKAENREATFYVPLIVVVEMVYVLERVYKIPKAQVREMVESLLTLPIELENLEVVVSALDLYERQNLKFGDALVLATAKVKGIEPVYTLDRDSDKFPEAVVL